VVGVSFSSRLRAKMIPITTTSLVVDQNGSLIAFCLLSEWRRSYMVMAVQWWSWLATVNIMWRVYNIIAKD